MLEHDYRPKAMVDPTCTEWGYTVYACSGCDTCYNSNYTEPWGHTYTQHTYAPTLEAQGYTEYTCASCGYSYLDNFVEKLTLKEETVYATCAVNIRSGPGTEYALLDTLYYGESILKLADADSEWSLVQYGNTYAYMYSAYLSTTKPEPVSAYALIGTFSIPAVGVEVDCYDSYSQEVVDAYNSAALFRHQGHDVIADHVNQGFGAIKFCTPGTKAYLYTPNGTYEYVCADVIQGHNDGYNLTDENGNLISDTYPGSLVCYTCNDSSQNITLVFFEAVGSAKEDNERDPNGLGHSFHTWSDWVIAWEVYEDDGDHYGWRKRICTVCGEEEWISL